MSKSCWSGVTPLSQVLGGAWVFPGGKADACDADPRILAAQGAVAFPGHAQHPVAAMALPGPSFLVYRNERFEPADGFAALLG